MDFSNMTIEQMEERKAAIAAEIENSDADLDALEKEIKGINEEIEKRKKAEEKRAKLRADVAGGSGEVVARKDIQQEGKKMGVEEIRNSKAYINAFANYIKTGDDSECRALLTDNVSGGQVPVPTYIEGRIRTAWERIGLMDLVRKTYIKGNLKIGFELSATGAVTHVEGTSAPDEEELTFGVVSLIPASIKKWIRISDEAVDMGGEDFLNYIYDELAYQIGKEVVRQLITKITEAPAASTATAAGVPAIEGTSSELAIVAKAVANLADDATDPTVVMNKLTYADFVAAMAKNGYKFDPFEGYRVEFNNTLPAYAAAETGDKWMIVGDFANGAQANFPNGDEIRIKYDDLTESQADLVKLVGREYVATGIVAPNHFVTVTK